MASLRNPQGPHSNRVYWRRRIVVLVALVAIIVAIVLIVVAIVSPKDGGGSVSPSESSAASQPSAAPETDADPEEPVESSGVTGEPDSDSEDQEPEATQSATGPTANTDTIDADSTEYETCAGGNVDVEAVTDFDSYDGVDPQFSFIITNNGANPCTIDAGTTKQVFSVTSGDDQYWISTDCQKKGKSQLILLEPDSPVTSSALTWDRTYSDPDTCSKDRDSVPADGASYQLSVTVGGITSDATKQFMLK